MIYIAPKSQGESGRIYCGWTCYSVNRQYTLKKIFVKMLGNIFPQIHI